MKKFFLVTTLLVTSFFSLNINAQAKEPVFEMQPLGIREVLQDANRGAFIGAVVGVTGGMITGGLGRALTGGVTGAFLGGIGGAAESIYNGRLYE